jgi:hypothetical protein
VQDLTSIGRIAREEEKVEARLNAGVDETVQRYLIDHKPSLPPLQDAHPVYIRTKIGEKDMFYKLVVPQWAYERPSGDTARPGVPIASADPLDFRDDL